MLFGHPRLHRQPLRRGHRRTIFELHRLAHEGFSVRKIAATWGGSRQSVQKYLDDPTAQATRPIRARTLDPYTDDIARMLEADPKVSAAVIRQHLQEHGFDGGSTIVRDSLSHGRPRGQAKAAFIRFASAPGVQCQIDWGHFGALTYGHTQRQLSCLAVVEGHSRLLSREFTHSQRQEALHRCLLGAFRFFQGPPKEVVHDNMLTTVIEHQGPVGRCNEQFLEFLRPFHINPIACNIKQPQEKGKVEKGAIHYIRQNFWPLRPFPDVLPECRDTAVAKVHRDCAVQCDGNFYSALPWAIAKTLTVKADHRHVTLSLKEKASATHTRCWGRHQRLELPGHRQAAQQHRQRHWLSPEVATFVALGDGAKTYLEQLATTQQPLHKSVKKRLDLTADYGTLALLETLERASPHKAYGAHYIENMLYQEMTPQRQHPPVRRKQDHLNQIRLDEPSLAEFDTFILKRHRS